MTGGRMIVDGTVGMQGVNAARRPDHRSTFKDLEVEFLKVVIDQTLPKKASGFDRGLASQVGRDHLTRELARMLVMQGNLDLALSNVGAPRAETQE